MTADLAVIVAFVEARLAEDKHYADGLLLACRIPEKVPDFFAAGGPAAEAYWAHFRPARMLREIEAKRAILARHQPDSPEWPDCKECSCEGALAATECFATVRWPCPTLRDLATAWSYHPDYPFKETGR